MIRKIVIITMLAICVASCASKKVRSPQTAYPPAQFIISDIAIDNAASPKADRALIGLLREAANNTREVYNDIAGDRGSIYNLELTLNRVLISNASNTVMPVTNNLIEMTATLRQPESGVAMRTVPVRHQLVSLDADVSREQQLIRGVLSEAFNGVYGLRTTPSEVMKLVKSDALFGGTAEPVIRTDPAPRQQPSQSKPSASSSPVSVETQSSGEPTVIGCNIC